MTTDTQMRADFEKWVSRRYPQAGATDADDRFENHLWECWQAALQINAAAPSSACTQQPRTAAASDAAAPISAQEALAEALKIFDWLERRSIYQDDGIKAVHEKIRAALSNASEPLSDEQCDDIAMRVFDARAVDLGLSLNEINMDVWVHATLRRELIRAGAAPTGNAPDGWVPVSERLPKRGGTFVVAGWSEVAPRGARAFDWAFCRFRILLDGPTWEPDTVLPFNIGYWFELPAAPLDSKGST